MKVNWTKENFINGEILLFDKPYTWTSFQLVNKVRYTICKKYNIKKLKVGHAGTLDPLATGLLIICTGKATKQINMFQDMEKTYIAEIALGAITPSYDMETKIDKTFDTDHITLEKINNVLFSFQGESEQMPPIFSAKYVNGERAYNLARNGKEAVLKPNRINISNIELKEYEQNKITIKVTCSKGTYIRSLAHDIGQNLDSGAYLSALKRTNIGQYNVSNSLTFNDFNKILQEM